MRDFFNNIVSSIGITDILDILIVAFIVYKVLGFIRETRAEQLAKGLLVLVVGTLLSDICHLYTLHWILSNVMTVGMLALVVLFQPELRRALEKLGRSKFINITGDVDKDDAKRIVTEISKAVESMSASRTGALMVIERETTLNDIVETGTLWDTLENMDHEMSIVGWSYVVMDPDVGYYSLYKKDDLSGNYTGWGNEETDGLLQKGRTSTDTEERDAIYSELEEKYQGAAPYVPLYWGTEFCAHHEALQGVKIPPCSLYYVYDYSYPNAYAKLRSRPHRRKSRLPLRPYRFVPNGHSDCPVNLQALPYHPK